MSTGAIRADIDRVEAAIGTAAVDATARADATAGQFYDLSIPIDLALVVGNADIVTDVILGHKFQIVAASFLVTEAIVLNGGSTVTLQLDVEATPVTGGVIVLSAASARGVWAAGTAITAGNAVSATQKISVRSESVTAHTSGKGILILRLKSVA